MSALSTVFRVGLICAGILLINTGRGFRSGQAEPVIRVGTGDAHSASWQFTQEISSLWNRAYPDEPLAFVPVYEDAIESRFERLSERALGLVIAPYTSQSEQYALMNGLKVVGMLWQVYLVPITLGEQKEAVGRDNYPYWYYRKQSVIAPLIRQAMKFDCQPDVSETASGLGNSADGFGEEKPEYGLFTGPSSELTAIKVSPPTEPSTDGPPGLRHGIKPSPPEPEQSPVVFCLERSTLLDLVLEKREGVFFYEMAGSLSTLRQALEIPIVPVELGVQITAPLLEANPWLQKISLSEEKLRTIGFDMALYAHEQESPARIEKIVRMLNSPPAALTPKSHLMKQLVLDRTRRLSPLMLHPGTKRYYRLD